LEEDGEAALVEVKQQDPLLIGKAGPEAAAPCAGVTSEEVEV
jgi:hypothetical protein